MTYQIGEILPLDMQRGITGREIEPTWYALLVPPQKERAATEVLRAKNVHATYPTRERKRIIRGKPHVRKLPIVSRIVYAKFRHEPQWDVLKYRRIITGVFSRQDCPIAIPSEVMRAVMGLATVEEELEAARRDMLRVRAGDRAEIADGPLAGFMVDVERVHEGWVWWRMITGIAGVRGDGPVGSLDRREGR